MTPPQTSDSIHPSVGNEEQPAAAAAPSDTEAAAIDRAARLKSVRDKVARLLTEHRYDEARRALKEAEDIEAEESNAQRLVDAKVYREKAAELSNEGKYSEAKQFLERADEMEAAAKGWKDRPKRLIAAIRSRIPERSKPERADADGSAAPAEAAADPVAESSRIVSLYSKIAAAVGLLPGGLLNFAAILAVQVLMVWRIAKAFGHKESKEQVRGVILSLFGSIIPTGIGHGAGLAIASIPAIIAGTVVYFVATPILAYALTRAVGNVFIMHFESGGTLLTFDPKAFADYFISEFQRAGGTLRKADETTAQPVQAAVH